jgi:hypothetical protein
MTASSAISMPSALRNSGSIVMRAELALAGRVTGPCRRRSRRGDLLVLELSLALVDLALHPRRLAHQLVHSAAELHGRGNLPNMSYVVLARKWRPQSFEDLVGQEHVATTLGNAIAQNRVAHAFLFTGVRGVGKTTSARILAKALNCEKGPTASPASCARVRRDHRTARRRRPGDRRRELQRRRRRPRSSRRSCRTGPQRDRFKIFIVDEVHMLS